MGEAEYYAKVEARQQKRERVAADANLRAGLRQAIAERDAAIAERDRLREAAQKVISIVDGRAHPTNIDHAIEELRRAINSET